MIKALPYTMLVCCWLPLSAAAIPVTLIHSDTPGLPVTLRQSDTLELPVTLIPSSPAAPLSLRILPDTAFRHYPALRVEWQLFLNGVPAKKGITAPFQPIVGRPSTIHLPVRLTPGPDEAFLRVTIRPPASRLHPSRVFTRLLPLRPWHPDNAITPNGELSFTDTLGIFTITSPNTLIRFDKQTGWLLHYETGHTLLMGDSAGLQPMLWSPQVQPHLQLFSTSTGEQLIIVRAEYTLPEAGCLLHLSYTINAAGDMLVGQSTEPDTTHEPPPANSPHLPPLTRFGMRWILPHGFDSVSWYGGSPNIDTPGIYHIPVSPSRETAFAFVRWLTIQRMQILADSSLLQISAIPIIDSAGRRTILGIDATLPSPAHPLPAGTMNYTFKVSALPDANIQPARSSPANTQLPRSPAAKPF